LSTSAIWWRRRSPRGIQTFSTYARCPRSCRRGRAWSDSPMTDTKQIDDGGLWRPLFWLNHKLDWLADLPHWRIYIVGLWLPLVSISASLIVVGVLAPIAIAAASVAVCLFWSLMLAASTRELAPPAHRRRRRTSSRR